MSSVLLTDGSAPEIRRAAGGSGIRGWTVEQREGDDLIRAIDSLPSVAVLLITSEDPSLQRAAVEHARNRGIAVVMQCADEEARRRAVELRVDEWYRTPAEPEEIEWRLHSAIGRVAPSGTHLDARVRRDTYEEMLYDALTGLPTLPVMIERTRADFKEHSQLMVLYLHFVRYSKIEEIYGWERLDGVLETTSAAVRDYLDSHGLRATKMMLTHANDDDFVFFHVPTSDTIKEAEQALTDLPSRVREYVSARLEEEYGEEIASLVEVYVGTSRVYYNPRIRLERLIYRGVREASNDARSVEERERMRKVSELRRTLREGAVYMDYHPIVRTDTGEIFGYEALARGRMRSLRSPEVMFEVAAEADLVWELSRLCRRRAIEGMKELLGPDQLLFLNVDPYDFSDPLLEGLDVSDPSRVVIEITERTAIRDYGAMRQRLASFRERGFRIAVDDAGSGYAGLGSIANLDPDFIKLDISLISFIDSNFLKQNLVESMVRFANEHGVKVIAEGVERREELETLKSLGVHLVQGFLLHRPSHPGQPVPVLTADELNERDVRAEA